MTILVTIQAQLVVGEEQVIKSLAPEGMLAAVFEDDGRTGYFYALDESVEGNPIMDAVHIYNAEDVSDGHIPSDVKIGWSEDSQKCVLLINGYPHGAFDFVGKNDFFYKKKRVFNLYRKVISPDYKKGVMPDFELEDDFF